VAGDGSREVAWGCVKVALDAQGAVCLFGRLITMRTLCLLAALCTTFVSALAQTPSADTMRLSVRTMSKALAGCRESYTRVYSGDSEPLLMAIVGTDNYEKDLTSLERAQNFANVLIAHPDKLSGKLLVAILSTSDDFSIGVGSTRAEALRHIVIDQSNVHRQQELMLAAESLNDCQKSLFNAGDDFVELVMNYVGAEDVALAARNKTP
jgi:hypothetical protein